MLQVADTDIHPQIKTRNVYSETFLVADVGGTYTRFGLAIEGEPLGLIQNFMKLENDKFESFYAACEFYIARIGHTLIKMMAFPLENIAVAAAGPVINRAIDLTNRDWTISENELASSLNMKRVCLMNDFTALARSIPELDSDIFIPIHEGQKNAHAPVLVAGAGTGFGVAVLVPLPSGWKVIPTEGGHQSFKAHTKIEFDVKQELEKVHGYVSLERVVSGHGLEDLHRVMCNIFRTHYEPLSPKLIQDYALQGDRVCHEVCRLQANATMSALGDMVLSMGGLGGVVLTGGVSSHMLPFYTKSETLMRFEKRGPRTDYIRNVPIQLLTDSHAPLIGCAAFADDIYMKRVL